MKASELILRLSKLIKTHGDLPIVSNADHDVIEGIAYEPKSWIIDIRNPEPVFELGAYDEDV